MQNRIPFPHKPLLFFGFLALFLPPGKVARASSWNALPPLPTGLVRVTRPAIRLPVTPVGDTQITDVSLMLNEAVVPAAYSAAKRAVVYVPASPLPPGEYDVKCRVIFDGDVPFDREWHFTIAAEAITDLPTPDARQVSAFEAVNVIRRSLGLPPCTLDNALCAAAQAHARYLLANRPPDAHRERLDQPGATGVLPQDRAIAFGYDDRVSEDVSQGSTALLLTPITELFDAPYHRIPFLLPDGVMLGAGSAGEPQRLLVTTLEFGQSPNEATLVSPFAGQKEVPTRWNDHENPDPLRIHPADSRLLPVGYPLVFVHFASPTQRITVTSASLTTAAGESVTVLVNTPDNDTRLINAAFVIPQKPLTPNTTYHISVKAATAGGVDISRAWDFTSGADSAGGESDLEQASRFRAAPPAPIEPPAHSPSPATQGGESPLTALWVVYADAHLQVTFPKDITGLQCFFDNSPALTRSSPAVHEVNGVWQARYLVPAAARTYRLAVAEGLETHLVSGVLPRLIRTKSKPRPPRP